jgi:DivIVA domain-containing protein
MLSPADVEQKTFSTALRGYDLDEVDDFLDEVVATLKDLNEQIEVAKATEDEAPAAAPPPVPQPEAEQEPEAEPSVEVRPEIDESAIGRALIAAQNAADKLLEEAQVHADRIVEEARSEADSFISERDARRREVEAEMAALSSRVASVRSELSVLAGQVAGKLDDMDTVIAEANEPQTGPPEGDHTAVVDGPPENEPPESPSAEGRGGDDGADKLGEILDGLATDLQFESEDDGDGEDRSQDDGWGGY